MATRASTWLVPVALVALGTIPVIAGSLRLFDLSTGSTRLPPNPRFSASPLPVVVHIVSASVFAMLGALQFSPRLRRPRRVWHRRAGRVVLVAALGVALSALYLNQFFPRAGATRELLYPLRVVFAVAMVATVALGFRAARRGHFADHREWMIRSYAIGMSPAPRSSPSALVERSSATGSGRLRCSSRARGPSTSPSPSGPSAIPSGGPQSPDPAHDHQITAGRAIATRPLEPRDALTYAHSAGRGDGRGEGREQPAGRRRVRWRRDGVCRDKIPVGRMVGEVIGLGLTQCKGLVDNAPGRIKGGLTRAEAEALQKRVAEAGGPAEIK